MTAEKRRRGRRRKAGLLACFDPPAVADEGVDPEGAVRRVPSSSDSLPKSSSAVSSVSSPWDEGEDIDHGRRKRFSRRAFSRIVRAALFVSSLQKGRNGRALPDSKLLPTPPLGSSGVQPSNAVGCPWDENDPSSDTGFSTSPPLSYASSATSAASSSTVTSPAPPTLAPEPGHPRRAPAANGYGASGTGVCLLVLFVLVLVVFWGRLCAIIWTSAGLYVVLVGESQSGVVARRDGRRHGVPRPSTTAGKEWSEEWEKRRVVLEGLLDRRRRP